MEAPYETYRAKRMEPVLRAILDVALLGIRRNPIRLPKRPAPPLPHGSDKRHLSGLSVRWLAAVMFSSIAFACGSLWIAQLPPDVSRKAPPLLEGRSALPGE